MRLRLVLGALFAVALAHIPGPAAATSHSRLIYSGGPVLANFTIYPLYYGDWSGAVNTAVQQANQAYLQGLAQYLSGQSPPPGQKPTPWQYVGPMSVSVASPVTAGSNVIGPTQVCDTLNPSTVCAPAETTVNDIIHASQANGTLHPYDANSLIMVFLPQGFTISFAPKSSGCSYHWFENNSSFYAIVQTDASCGPLLAVTGHELFEAVTDPTVGPGWDGSDGQESTDVCNIYADKFNLAGIDQAVAKIVTDFSTANPGLTFPWDTTVQAAVPGIADDTQPDPANPMNVLCSKTGYYTPPAPPPSQICSSVPVGGSSKFKPFLVSCLVICPLQQCEIFYPDPLFNLLTILAQPCLACGYEVVLGGAALRNWTAEVVNANGAPVPQELLRQDNDIILRLKPSPEDIKSGAINAYRLKLIAKKEANVRRPSKIYAGLRVSREPELAGK